MKKLLMIATAILVAGVVQASHPAKWGGTTACAYNVCYDGFTAGNWAEQHLLNTKCPQGGICYLYDGQRWLVHINFSGAPPGVVAVDILVDVSRPNLGQPPLLVATGGYDECPHSGIDHICHYGSNSSNLCGGGGF